MAIKGTATRKAFKEYRCRTCGIETDFSWICWSCKNSKDKEGVLKLRHESGKTK